MPQDCNPTLLLELSELDENFEINIEWINPEGLYISQKFTVFLIYFLYI
jgi:hypothetical protein